MVPDLIPAGKPPCSSCVCKSKTCRRISGDPEMYGKCVKHCQEGFFVDEESRECEPCHRACRTCGGPLYDDCDSCAEEFTLSDGECLKNKQLSSCPEKFFRNSRGECEQCYPSCKTCSDVGKKDCISCHSGHFLMAGQTCTSRCPAGTFSNTTSGRCEDCSKGCTLCRDTQQCNRCRDGLYLHDGVCVVDCPRGFPQNGVCQPCAPECASCSGNASHCLSCEEKYLLLDRSCRAYCPEGYYSQERECYRCPADCKTCNQDGLCQKCADYFFLHEDKCVDDCPTGYFASEKEQECVRCHADCHSCDGPDVDDCLVCRNPKAVRYNGECLPSCPDSTFHDKTVNECRDCDPSCLTCSGNGPSSCLSCNAKHRKDANGHCVWYSECPLTSYMDKNEECQECHKSCHRCSGPGPQLCLSCNMPKFLLNTTCVKECPVGFYPEDRDKQICERCHFSCESCVGHHSVQCVQCKPGFFKQGSSCVQSCSESNYGNTSSKTCERCDPACSRCWGPSSKQCLNCRTGYFFMKKTGQCVKSCPAGYYHHSWSRTCLRCHPTCRTCRDGGALACQSCYDGYTLLGGSICESRCLTGFYAASQASKSQRDDPDCRACDPACFDCRGPGIRNCTLCPVLQILAEDGRCLSCCGEEARRPDAPLPWECCDCEASRVECILGVNYVMRSADDLEAEGGGAKVFVTTSVFIILFTAGGLFIFLQVRSRSHTLIGMPQTKAEGYEKLNSSGDVGSQPTVSSFGDYSDRIIECEEDMVDEEDDIVYMGQDGTVYRKFKYGLLDDEEIDLEYDDESYSYR